MFPVQGSPNRQLGTRLDGINCRESPLHSLKGSPSSSSHSTQVLKRACGSIMGDGLNAGAAAVLTDVGGKQVRPSVGGERPDAVGGVQSGLP